MPKFTINFKFNRIMTNYTTRLQSVGSTSAFLAKPALPSKRFLLLKKALLCAALLCASLPASAQVAIPKSAREDRNGVMSEAYWKQWNPAEQARIDRDIEKYRKADGEIAFTDIAEGSEVRIEQISHDFFFGAHIFNFNQLGRTEYNDRYKELYGTLFNSATVAFYWKKFEMQPERLRFREEYWDTEQFWNGRENPYAQPHWRRPAPDPVVAFCESRGIRIHGHVLIWGNRQWHHPEWLPNYMTPEERTRWNGFFAGGKLTDEYPRMGLDELEQTFVRYADTLRYIYDKRIRDIAAYYGDRIDSWDVVNESATDDERGLLIPGRKLCKSTYGLMPGDYPYRALKSAEAYFPADIKLNINDYRRVPCYAEQVKELLRRGCKIDVMGVQMHLFDPKLCLDIAEGHGTQTPEEVRRYLAWMSEPGLPLHLSEITITSPGDDERGRMIQAIIARNLYRLWFSCERMTGITWWNVVDNCGAPGEPSTSGLFTRDMQPKPSYYALEELINNEWKTRLTARPDKEGSVRFRGFRGKYRITWTDREGNTRTRDYYLK